uniref:Uncharacterized protein n=1 Tax=viral metagenome TaxID=1070528 RepID=A0A2V0RL44_9ZZZZ
MSIHERTKRYAVEVAEASLNAFETQARGTLEAPSGDENVRLYTAKGGSAVTLSSTTSSAAVIFDPESTLRNGQTAVHIYERNSAGSVIAAQTVNLGRSTSEFISAGVLSAGMKVFNSSGVDVIGGTQSQAVLTAVPRDISTITTTDLSNFCPNHQRDLISGVISREEASMTMAMTEHFGKKMALSRSNMIGNTVKRSWDDSLGTRRTTVGETLGKTVDTTYTLPTNSETDIATYLTTKTALVFADSNNLTEANNPLTFATYNVDFDAYCLVEDAGATQINYQVKVALIGYDSANNVVASASLNDYTTTSQAGTADRYDLQFRGSLSSSTRPITRVILAWNTNNGASNASTELAVSETVFKLTGYEETSDVPARAVQVCVLEGLNASATLNISSYAVLTGVPDSTNTFISAGDTQDAVYDNNAVEIFLKSITRVMPRAFTTRGHSAVSKTLSAMYGDEVIDISFKAMSFSGVSQAVKRLSKLAKATGKDVASLLDDIDPAVHAVGRTLSAMPGPAGAAGSAMMLGSDAYRMVRR